MGGEGEEDAEEEAGLEGVSAADGDVSTPSPVIVAVVGAISDAEVVGIVDVAIGPSLGGGALEIACFDFEVPEDDDVAVLLAFFPSFEEVDVSAGVDDDDSDGDDDDDAKGVSEVCESGGAAAVRVCDDDDS